MKLWKLREVWRNFAWSYGPELAWPRVRRARGGARDSDMILRCAREGIPLGNGHIDLDHGI